MYITGTAKTIHLLKTLKHREMRALPFSTLWTLRKFLKDEKLVRINGQIVVNSFLPPFPGEAFRTLARGVQLLAKGKAIPVSTYIGVTNRCRYRCWHCSKEYRPASDLSSTTVTETIKQLQQLGVSIIGFTGGEPLLRDDLEDMIRSVDSRSTTLLFTTGDGLTEERARSLKSSGLFGVAVSLDHFDHEVHDKRRGREGAFRTACRAVRISREHGFYTMLQLVATKDMADDGMFAQYLRLAQRLGVHEIRLLEPMPTGRLLRDSDNCRLTDDERRKLFLLHRKTNKPGKTTKVCSFAYIEDGSMYGCGAGLQHMYIDAEGNVCPCDFVPISFGNVRNEDLVVVWKRMRGAFSRPGRRCFLMCKSHRLQQAFKGDLPIPYEEAKEICEFSHSGGVPDYYKALGWA